MEPQFFVSPAAFRAWLKPAGYADWGIRERAAGGRGHAGAKGGWIAVSVAVEV